MNLPVRERSSEGVIDLESRRPKSIEISVKTDKNYRALSKREKAIFGDSGKKMRSYLMSTINLMKKILFLLCIH